MNSVTTMIQKGNQMLHPLRKRKILNRKDFRTRFLMIQKDLKYMALIIHFIMINMEDGMMNLEIIMIKRDNLINHLKYKKYIPNLRGLRIIKNLRMVKGLKLMIQIIRFIMMNLEDLWMNMVIITIRIVCLKLNHLIQVKITINKLETKF